MLADDLWIWFNQTDLGNKVKQQEYDFFKHSLQGIYAPILVQTNLAPWNLTPNTAIKVGQDVFMQPEAMAWANESIHALVMPHLLEFSAHPHFLLHEAWRVLQPEGKLILTAFNPHSLWGYAGLLDGKALPKREQCLSYPQLKQLLSQKNWNISYKKFMVYNLPLTHHTHWQFMENTGKRWWPYAAAVYGLIASKCQIGVHPLTDWQTNHQLLNTDALILGTTKQYFSSSALV